MPTGIPGKATIICPDCGEEKEYHALERCAICYWKYYRKKNREAYRAQGNQWRKDNPKKAHASSHRYYQAHPDDWRIRKIRRRARKAQVANTLTQAQIDFETNIAQSMYPDKKLHIHHVVPISKGGNHSWGNIMVIPASLNCSIGDKLPQEVYQQKDFLSAF